MPQTSGSGAPPSSARAARPAGRSDSATNEWPIDEGWWGVGIAGTALGFGLFGLLDPMEWGEVEVQPQGLASRRPAGSGSGLARGAALSLSW